MFSTRNPRPSAGLPARACAACAASAAPGALFCAACGAALPRACPACAAPAQAEHRFCSACGVALGKAEGPPPAAAAWAARGASAERRLMTIMFCDLVGSSRLAARLDPEDYAALLVAYRECCTAAAARHGGYVSRYEGDGVLACFGYPRALGRDAQAAVACALGIVRQAPRELARATARAGTGEIALRIGIETGLVLAGRLDPGGTMVLDGLVGTALNTAARLQQLAPPNGVVVGEAARELVVGDFELEELPADRLVALEPSAGGAFAVVREASRGERRALLARRRAPLVGRAAELALLIDRWERACQGHGQAVLLSGEPGVGKSRLVQELLDRLTGTPHAAVVLACTPQTAATPLHPATAALREAIARAEDRGGRSDGLPPLGVPAAVGAAAPAPGPTDAVLAEALGLGPGPGDLAPAARRRVLMEALQTWLLGHADLQPALIVAEDLHWSDPSLLELLQGLTDLLRGRRVLLLATYRSDFLLAWPDRPATLRMTLPPLEEADAGRLLDGLLRGASATTREAILSRADGIPLFIEEFALAAKTPAVPRTLQQLFTARLDALGEAKALAQCASVLGREVEPDVLAALSGLAEPLLQERIAHLAAAEVLVRTGPGPGAPYAFRHAVLQQAAHESVPLAERRPLHAQAAALLAELRPGLVDRRPELLAEHHAEAGEFAAAAPLFAAAARRALGTAALDEAETQVRRGLAAAAALPAAEAARPALELELLLGLVLIAKQGYASGAVQETYERALRLADAVPDETHILAPLRGLTSFYQVRGPLSRAGQLCDRLVAAAERSGDACMLMDSWRRRGWYRCCAGRLSEAEADLTRALEVFDAARSEEHVAIAGDDPRVLALANLCWLDLRRHGAAAAARRAKEAAAAAQGSAHPLSTCYGLVFAAFALQAAERWDEAKDLVEGALLVAEEKGFAYWVALCWAALGYDRIARRCDAEAGRDLILRGLSSYRETQGELLRPLILSLLAEAHRTLGDAGRARSTVREAVAVAGALEAQGYVPGLLLQEARLLTAPELRSERRTLLESAVEIARAQAAFAIERAAAEELRPAAGMPG